MGSQRHHSPKRLDNALPPEPADYRASHSSLQPKQAACSVGWWLMTGAGLFREKSTVGWLLVAGLF
jgi:hypothetical protein